MFTSPRAFHGVLVLVGSDQFTPQLQLLEYGDKVKGSQVPLIPSPIIFPDGCNRFALTPGRFFKPKPFLQLQPRDGWDIPKHLPAVSVSIFVVGRGQHKVQPVKIQLGGNLVV